MNSLCTFPIFKYGYVTYEVKIFFYLGYVKHSLEALDTFAVERKVTKHIGIYHADLAWYSPSTTCQICHYGLEYGLEIWLSRFMQPE